MIDFKGKSSEALSAAIVAAGHWVRLHDNVPVASDEAAVQAIIDSYTLDQAKAEKARAISLHAKNLRDKVVAAISAGEMASWPIKRAEADAFAADPNAACPALSAEAQKRGIALADLVAKVNSNAARFLGAETAIGGTDGLHRDAIAAMTTFEEVAAYDYTTGWPEV